MTQTLEQLVVELRGDIGSLRRELRVGEQLVGQSARRMERDGKQVAGVFQTMSAGAKAFGGVIAALGVAEVVSGFARMAREAIAQAGALSDVSEKVGLTAERYQELRFTLRETGGELSALETGLATFARNLSNLDRGEGPLAKFLENADPGFARTLRNARDTNEALSILADRVAALASREDQLALAQAALGRGGREFVNVLAGGSEALAQYARQASEAGAVISNETVAAADELEDAIGRITDVALARFTEGLVNAGDRGRELTDLLSDPETISRIGEMAEAIGRLADATVRFVEASHRRFFTLQGWAFGYLPEFAGMELASPEEIERYSRSPLEDDGPNMTPIDPPGSMSEGEPFYFGAPQRPSYSPRLRTGGRRTGGSGRGGRAERDPLRDVLDTLRFEEQQLERITDARRQFEEEITRDFEQQTLTREQLIEREAERRIEKLEELGFAEEEAADLRVRIHATATEKIEALAEEEAEVLGRVLELGAEGLGEFLADNLFGDADASLGELVESFAKALVRMELMAAASNIGSILREKLLGATSGSGQSAGAAAGGSLIGALLSRVFRFADGGIVNGPVLGLIGEDARTRPEVVAPLDKLESLHGGGGGFDIEVVNAVPGVKASARRVPGRNGRDRARIELKAALVDLFSAGELRDLFGGRHAAGLR